jgi:UDP-N-acetylmuramoylalanine--D-glutamate ligase
MSVRFSALDGASIGVWGAGREIASFADQLARRLPAATIAAAVFDGPPPAGVLDTLRAPDARILTAAEAVAGLAGCSVLVRSPGVPAHRPELHALRSEGIEVTTATSLWLAEHGARGVIGVTGTKGKSTTAALISHLARAAGHTVDLVGNIGSPAIDLLDRAPAQITVVELSSYQIADLALGPEVALVTNLYREHTDWHGSAEAYQADKLRLLDLPGVRAVVLGGREQRLSALRPHAITTTYGTPGGWDVLAGAIAHAGRPLLDADGLEALGLRGEHNALNLCAALSALEAFGIDLPALPGGLEGFCALPHRLEGVLEHEGLEWINDSISTTPESAIAALASFPGREVILIAGGQDRGQEHDQLAEALAAAEATLIGVPSTGDALVRAARAAGVPDSRALVAGDLAAAVALARSLAPADGVILLSPAAPSYDNYRDFEERGELFRALARSAGASAE